MAELPTSMFVTVLLLLMITLKSDGQATLVPRSTDESSSSKSTEKLTLPPRPPIPDLSRPSQTPRRPYSGAASHKCQTTYCWDSVQCVAIGCHQGCDTALKRCNANKEDEPKAGPNALPRAQLSGH